MWFDRDQGKHREGAGDESGRSSALVTETVQMLKTRGRLAFWLFISNGVLFAFADFFLHPPPRDFLVGLKLCYVAGVFIAMRVLARHRTLAWSRGVILATLAWTMVLVVMADVATLDRVTTPIICMALVLSSALFFPWGAATQLVVVAIMAIAMIAHATIVDAGLTYTILVVLMACVASVFIAIQYAREYKTRIRVQWEIKYNERRFRSLIEKAWDGAALLDAEGRIFYASPRVTHLIGYTPEQLVGRKGIDLVHPDDLLETRQALARVAAGQERDLPIELRFLHVDGSWRWFEAVGTNLLTDDTVNAVVINFRDISERKQAQAERAALWDSLEQRVADRTRELQARSECSRAMAHGGSESELIADVCRIVVELGGFRMAWVGLAEQDDRKTVRPVARAGHDEGYLDSADITWADSDRGRGPTGTAIRSGKPYIVQDVLSDPAFLPWWAAAVKRRYRSSIALPLMDADRAFGALNIYSEKPSAFNEEEVELLLGLASDLAYGIKARRTGAEHRQLAEHLRQAQRMEAVGRLAGGVAHDFNNFLFVIEGYCGRLADTVTDDRSQQALAEIMKATEQCAQLTRQLLAFGRRQVLQPEVLDINNRLREAEKMLAPLIGEDIILRVKVGKSPNLVRVDPGQIEQVIVNLAVNARGAMPTGGRLTIETARVDLEEADVRIEAKLGPGPYVLLSVSDTGSGMDAETLSHIFEPFFTTKGVGEGTGLGLATVHGIVEQSGGHITVVSEPGRGSTFKIYLPRLEITPEKESRPEEMPKTSPCTGTVLVVEDEDPVRRLVVAALESEGYTVLQAGDGVDGLRAAREFDGCIDLLLTDVIMPRMSGRQLADHLTADRPHMRVIYLSGHSEDTILRHGVQQREVHFLYKPCPLKTIVSKVHEVLAT